MKRVDMTGRTFTRLTVLSYAGNDSHTGNAQCFANVRAAGK